MKIIGATLRQVVMRAVSSLFCRADGSMLSKTKFLTNIMKYNILKLLYYLLTFVIMVNVIVKIILFYKNVTNINLSIDCLQN